MKNDLDFEELYSVSALNIPLVKNDDKVTPPIANCSTEKLLDDLRGRDKAISQCSIDIRNLRKENQDLKDQLNRAVENDAKISNILENTLNLSNTEVRNLSKETLIQLASKLVEKTASLKFENQALIDTMQEAKQAIKNLGDLKLRHKELETAHMLQSKQLQKIQSQVKKMDTYKRTIETQEKVISRMQNVIESKINSNSLSLPQVLVPKDLPPSPHHDSEKNEDRQVENESTNEPTDSHSRYDELLEENETLKKRIADLEAQVNELFDSNKKEEVPQAELDSDDDRKEENLSEARRRIDILEAEVISKGYRIKALEEQLESSAKEYSKEIAQLRTKIFDLELNSTHYEADDMALFPEIPSFEESQALKQQSSTSTSAEVAAELPVGSALSAANALRHSHSAPLTASSKEESKSLKNEDEKTRQESAIPSPSKQTIESNKAEASPSKRDSNHSKQDQGVTQIYSMEMKRKEDGSGEEITAGLLTIHSILQKKEFQYEYSIRKIEVSGFLEEDMKGRFQPYVEISLGDDGTWKSSTVPLQDAGAVVQWLFGNEVTGANDAAMTFMITESQRKEGYKLRCEVRKLTGEAGANALLGAGYVSLN